MSNKPYSKLNELDILIRNTVKPRGGGDDDGTLLTIRFVNGFELFNTRPYHNYESWGSGYYIEGRGIISHGEDLDDALKSWADQVNSKE